MKKYKIFAQRRDDSKPTQVGPFLIDGENKKDAYEKALYHIKNALKLEGDYHLNVELLD